MAVADTLRVLSVFFAGITTGGMAFVYATVAPVMAMWSPERSLELHAAMLRYDPDRYIKPSGVIALLSSIAVVAVDTGAGTASRVLDGVGALGLVAIVVISEVWNVPVNRRVRAHPILGAPEYQALRTQWLRAHAWRTLSGVLALLLLSISLAVR